MARFVTRRIITMAAMLFAISVVTFLLFIVALPNGNPAALIAGRLANPAEIHLISVKYGFDKPIWDQYIKTMGNIFTGQAYSYQQGFNVDQEIKDGLPATLSLALGAGLFWLFASIALGTLAAVRSGKYTDRVLTVLAMVGVTSNPWQWFVHLIGPWFTLSVLFIGFYSRVLRSSIIDAMSEDYVRTARAKGLSERRVLLRHVLRLSMLPIISLWGLDIAQVIGGGAILTESVYGLHGVGFLAYTAVGNFDTVTLMSVVMLTALAVVIFSALIDIMYAVLDPRIRLS